MNTTPRGAFRFAFLIFLLGFVLNSSYAQNGSYQTESGMIDGRTWDFTNKKFPLSGYWAFYENKLLDPDSLTNKESVQQYFPKLFNEFRGNGQGCATYALTLIVPDSIRNFYFEIPQLYNSYTFWINGKEVARCGKAGETKETTTPQWRFRTISYDASNDTLHLVLQIANFHHYKGGAKDPIYIGTPERINHHSSWAFGTNIAEVIFLFLEAAVFVVLYLQERSKKVVLFFACLCLTWSVRAAFSNLYPITSFYPDFNWNILVKIEYITLFSAMVWSVFFINHLFRNITNQIVTYVLVGINIFFIVFTLLTDPLIFTRWISVYLAVAGITVAYCAVIVIKALVYGQTGAWFLMISLLCAGFVFGYDIIAYGSAAGYNLVFLHIGYIAIFMSVTIALLLHLGIVESKYSNTEILTYNDMFHPDEKKKKY